MLPLVIERMRDGAVGAEVSWHEFKKGNLRRSVLIRCCKPTVQPDL
jgi:hypothetical protein